MKPKRHYWTRKRARRFAHLVGAECVGNATPAELEEMMILSKLREKCFPTPPEVRRKQQRQFKRVREIISFINACHQKPII